MVYANDIRNSWSDSYSQEWLEQGPSQLNRYGVGTCSTNRKLQNNKLCIIRMVRLLLVPVYLTAKLLKTCPWCRWNNSNWLDKFHFKRVQLQTTSWSVIFSVQGKGWWTSFAELLLKPCLSSKYFVSFFLSFTTFMAHTRPTSSIISLNALNTQHFFLYIQP